MKSKKFIPPTEHRAGAEWTVLVVRATSPASRQPSAIPIPRCFGRLRDFGLQPGRQRQKDRGFPQLVVLQVVHNSAQLNANTDVHH